MMWPRSALRYTACPLALPVANGYCGDITLIGSRHFAIEPPAVNSIDPSAPADITRAAAYVRMSSSAQALSPKLQEAYLRRFARSHAMAVVRVYRDEGKSGLVLSGRTGMQQLLQDVASGRAGFSVLLIYDVSRWGRYQNIDEAGFYEYLCRQAGIRVLYCAEHFDNDGTPLSQLMKSFKRTMAAEYSRELSRKVLAAQQRLALMGNKQGGSATYGMRRVAVARDGRPDRPLAAGERKPRPSDRVRLMPGHVQEQATVRRIFELYNHQGWRAAAIRRLLNAEGVLCGATPWTDFRIFSILAGPQYWGTQAFNRSSQRLRTARVRHPRSEWICCAQALPATVAPAEGELASRIRAMRRGLDRAAILAAIGQVHARHGRVSYPLLATVPGMPGWRRLRRMFGSLSEACLAAGIAQPQLHRIALDGPARSAMLATVRAQVQQMAWRAGGSATALPASPHLLLNGRWTLRLALACSCLRPAGARWRVRVRTAQPADFVLAALLDTRNQRVARWALITPQQEPRAVVHFGSGRNAKSRGLLFPDLAALFGLPSAA